MLRQPAVAGQFYSASPEKLAVEVARYTDPSAVPRTARAAVSPHAGLMYSGHVAGAVYSRVALPATVILIGPNHTGLGPPVSIFPDGAWLIPGGEIPIDRSLAEAILARYPRAKADTEAHRLEHCLEMQLPFLRQAHACATRSSPDLKIVPIVLRTTREDVCRELGRCLADVIEAHTARQDGDTKPLLIASTDMNHYESDQVTREKDRFALDAIGKLDPAGLMDAVRTHGITM
ncbi:MAG: AmmeMemoRadiSam system protein B, partial [Nitrospirae bacterium]|nr:AmmeMemoRadiSam system protein B [Nitrospirota bacterium]